MPYKDKEKQKAAQAAHYQANKKIYLERSSAKYRRNQERMQKLKSAPCTDCKQTYPYYVMQFDHIGTAEKVEKVSRLVHNASWAKVLEEIEKCELVCANCHATRTWKRLGL